ncbi:MAG: xylan 1,4-beta-xylosidase [Clostridiales bacterium]|nr:xylan 1,4-beta-xylosidase [Clostridiales bacterium]
MAKEKRFLKVYSQSMGTLEIWVDKATGVNYLWRSAGYGGGLTPLLDAEGKPVVTPVKEGEYRWTMD